MLPAPASLERAGLKLAPDEFLEPLAVFALYRYAAIFIARYTRGPAFVEPIFALNNFVLGVGYIESKRKQQVPGNPFLQGDSSAWIPVIAAESRINRKAGQPGKPLDAAADFAGGALGQQRRRAQVGGRAGGLLGSLSARD